MFENSVMWIPGTPLEDTEKEIILKAYKFHRNDLKVTAESLKVPIKSLEKKLDIYAKHEIDKIEKNRIDKEKSDTFDLSSRPTNRL